MKIPEYDQRVPLPAPGPAPGITGEMAAAPWLGLAKVGQDTMELGKVIQDKQDEIFRVKELTDRSIQAENEIGDLKMRIEQKRDPQTAAEDYSTGLAEIKERTMDGVNDYKVANALTTHLANKEIEGTTQVKHAAYKWTLENDQMDLMSQNDRWKKAAINNPNQVDYVAGMIRGRIGASVATGSILPETARLLGDKEIKDLYAQVMGQMIITDPKSAPDAIKPLLLKSGLDPTDVWSMEQRAEHARASFEVKLAKGDKVVWDANAANASIAVRAGQLGEDGINAMYQTSKIGPEQLNHLQGVLDSFKTRNDGVNQKVSWHSMNSILLDVMAGRTTPDAASKMIDGNTNILPEHKTSGMQTLLQVGKRGDTIPPQFQQALKIYMTKTAPSFLSMNPREDQAEAAGAIMRDVWTDYLANEKKYQLDPDALIRRAIEKTSPAAVDGAGSNAQACPYATPEELQRAFDEYVVKQKTGRRPDIWQKWFNSKGKIMPPWPK